MNDRIVMGYDIWFWWMQSLSFIIVNPFLGPHLVSIGKMVTNDDDDEENEKYCLGLVDFS